jgi:hypothetical protein
MKYLAKEGDKRPDTAATMTNRFAGQIKLTAAEWEQVQKNCAEFRAYLA